MVEPIRLPHRFTSRARQAGKTQEMVAGVAAISGLSEGTCRELLRKGWSYIETRNEPSRWTAPVAQMREKNRDAPHTPLQE